MAGPSLYKPRRAAVPKVGSEVDSSVNYLLVGVIGLLMFLTTLIGMMAFKTTSPTTTSTSATEATRRLPRVDIGTTPVSEPNLQR